MRSLIRNYWHMRDKKERKGRTVIRYKRRNEVDDKKKSFSSKLFLFQFSRSIRRYYVIALLALACWMFIPRRSHWEMLQCDRKIEAWEKVIERIPPKSANMTNQFVRIRREIYMNEDSRYIL